MGRRSDRLLRAERWLADPRGLDAIDVVALIHAVNPTDRVHEPREREARYALKHALQSAALRMWPGAFEIRGAPGDEVVSIVHVLSGRDAGHALVSGLDEDAREQVWSGLGCEPEAPARPRSTPESADDALDRAMEEGDYRRAAELLTPAARGGDAAAARQLLELLLDYLDDPEACLEAAAELPGREDSELARLRAAACARTGRLERARQLLAGLRGPEVGRCWAEVAERALEGEDLGLSRRAVRGLREADPSARSVIDALEARWHALRDAPRIPLRQRVERAWRAGQGVEVALDALLEAFPDDEQGRDWRERLQREQHRARVDEALSRAEAVVEADPAAALRALQRVGQGARVQEIRARARRLLDARAAAARVRRIRLELRRGRTDAELLEAWRQLSPDEREQVGVDAPVLDWVASLRTRRGVHASAALAEAVEAVADGDAARARALVEPHRELLTKLDDGRAILVALDDLEARLEAEASERALRAVRAALAAGDLDLASERVSELGPVGAELRVEVDALLAEREESRAWDALLESPAVWRARIQALQRLTEQPGDPTWSERLQQAEAALGRAARMHREPAATPPSRLRTWELVPQLYGGAMRWVWRGQLVAVESWASWVRIRWCSLPALEVDGALLFRAPEGLDAQLHVHVEGGSVWLLDKAGRIVEVDLEARLPVRWATLPHAQDGQSRTVSFYARTLWVMPQRGGVLGIDLDDFRRTRRNRQFHDVGSAPGLDGLFAARRQDVLLADSAGRPVQRLGRRHLNQLLGLSWDSDREELVVCGRTEDVIEVGSWRDGAWVQLAHWPHPTGLQCGILATAAGLPLVFLMWGMLDDLELLALEADGAIAWRARAPVGSRLVQDQGGGPVYLLAPDGRSGWTAQELGQRRPADVPNPTCRLPSLYAFTCGRYECRSEDGVALVRRARSNPKQVSHLFSEKLAAGAEVVDLVEGVLIAGMFAVPSLDVEMQEEVLRDPTIRLLHADHLVAHHRDAEALPLLERTPAALLKPDVRPHRAHLLAVALARTGRLDEARAALDTVSADERSACPVVALRTVLEACADASPMQGDDPLVAYIKTLSRALCGPAEGLDVPALWVSYEPQLAARAASLALDDAGASVTERVWAAARIAWLDGQFGTAELLGPGVMPRAEVRAVAERAETWLGSDATLPDGVG